jgi:beta-lactam-binding protein with PASTA domain
MAAFLTTLLVLAVVGWSVGWLAASADSPVQETDASAKPSTPANRLSASPRPASASPSASPTAFGMPRLVGKTFRQARQQAFDLKLTVVIHFGEPAKNLPPGTVARTAPEETVLIRPGFQIVLYVTGPAPKVTVPMLAGKTCGEGTDALIQAGLKPHDYPSGDRGKVVKTDPPALMELTWDDPVDVYCAQVGG